MRDNKVKSLLRGLKRKEQEIQCTETQLRVAICFKPTFFQKYCQVDPCMSRRNDPGITMSVSPNRNCYIVFMKDNPLRSFEIHC
jgi:hypothetical protein